MNILETKLSSLIHFLFMHKTLKMMLNILGKIYNIEFPIFPFLARVCVCINYKGILFGAWDRIWFSLFLVKECFIFFLFVGIRLVKKRTQVKSEEG